MEELIRENIYIVDLGHIDNVPEIIYELSSVLDKPEARNKKICLKLGNTNLNQAQLLSIKSLISGIDSILSCIDTKSIETEKVALSLGIIVSDVSLENTLEVAPEMTYKTAEEYREQMQQEEAEADSEQKNIGNENTDSVESDILNTESNSENNAQDYEIIEEESGSSEQEQKPYEADASNTESELSSEDDHKTSDETENLNSEQNDGGTMSGVEDVLPKKEEITDELDVIFGSNPLKTSIFESENIPEEEKYEQKEFLDDIPVPESEYTKEDIELEEFPTKYIKQTIRSGQVINYEGNIVIIGDCHPGCEITAFGDITVWGVLSGIAHAGSGGNTKARVRALKMNAIQLRIANCYSRRPDSLNTVYIEKTDSFTPEEARIINGEIVVFKIND